MVTITLTKIEAEHLSKFLDDLGDKYGNAGCNDYPVPNTDENWALYQSVNSDEDHKNEKRPNGKEIFFYDWMLVGYLKGKVDASIKTA